MHKRVSELFNCKSAADWPVPFDEDKFFFVAPFLPLLGRGAADVRQTCGQQRIGSMRANRGLKPPVLGSRTLVAGLGLGGLDLAPTSLARPRLFPPAPRDGASKAGQARVQGHCLAHVGAPVVRQKEQRSRRGGGLVLRCTEEPNQGGLDKVWRAARDVNVEEELKKGVEILRNNTRDLDGGLLAADTGDLCSCVCVCVRARARARACACVRVFVCLSMFASASGRAWA